MKRQILRKIQKAAVISVIVMVATVMFSVTASASEPSNFAKDIGIWLLENIAWIFLVGGICTAGFMAIKRNVTGALITLAVTALAFVVALNAEAVLTALGNMLTGILGLD